MILALTLTIVFVPFSYQAKGSVEQCFCFEGCFDNPQMIKSCPKGSNGDSSSDHFVSFNSEETRRLAHFLVHARALCLVLPILLVLFGNRCETYQRAHP